MATQASGQFANRYQVRVWGMDTNNKPFVQQAFASDISPAGARLEASCKIRAGEMIGVQFGSHKGRFRVARFDDANGQNGHTMRIECVDGKNIWGIIPSPATTIAAETAPAPPETANTLTGAAATGTSASATPGESTKSNERRSHQRFVCDGNAEVRAGDQSCAMYVGVSDISMCGCYLECSTPLPVGTGVAVTLHLRGFEIGVQGVVRTFHPMVGMGVQFNDLPDVTQWSLQQLLLELDAQPALKNADTASRAFHPIPTQDSNTCGKTLLMRETSRNLHVLEMAVTAEDVDVRLYHELREALTHARNVLTLAQHWMELKSENRDPFIVLPAMTSERARSMTTTCRQLAIDLDSMDVTHDTTGVVELRRELQNLTRRLGAATIADLLHN